MKGFKINIEKDTLENKNYYHDTKVKIRWIPHLFY